MGSQSALTCMPAKLRSTYALEGLHNVCNNKASTEKEDVLADWIDFGTNFIVADVVRWREGAYGRPLYQSGRAKLKVKDVRIGERELIVEFLSERDAKGFV